MKTTHFVNANGKGACTLFKHKSLPLIALLICIANLPQAHGADAKAELDDLVSKIKTKLEAGKTSSADHAEVLKRFDELLTEHKGEKTDEVANILFTRAMCYGLYFAEPDKGTADLQKLKTEFADTAPAKQADDLLRAITQMKAAQNAEKQMIVGSKPPDFNETSLDGKSLSPTTFKGKVVLIDFWATWCGPCRAELPNLLNVYKKYHDKGFEIIGISLDKDKDKLAALIKEEKIAWPQVLDGEMKVSTAYGVSGIPMTYLLDKNGKLHATNLRGEALEAAVKTALADN